MDTTQLKGELWYYISKQLTEEVNNIDKIVGNNNNKTSSNNSKSQQKIDYSDKFVNLLMEIIFDRLQIMGQDMETFMKYNNSNRHNINKADLMLLLRNSPTGLREALAGDST